MNIQIDGTDMLNRGAELMLIAVLEQIEKRRPSATVYYNTQRPLRPYIQEQSGLDLRQRPALKYSRYPIGILKRLNLSFTQFTEMHPAQNIDLILDASGFQFSDQWNYSKERLDKLVNYYRTLKKNGTKIIMLPQALGPFETPAGKRAVDIIENYVDIIVAREEVSRKYLVDAGASSDKVWQCTDFTLLVKGTFPEKFSSVKDKFCIIPNKKMVTHTEADSGKYWAFLENLIVEIEKAGRDIFLLNHEGPGDLEMCQAINKRFENRFEVVSGLNAKDTKGIIGASYAAISSRFHGVASALNQGIPCLATSWNHKYEMLFKDFHLEDKILYLDAEKGVNEQKVANLLEQRQELHRQISERKTVLVKEVENMWNKVWDLV
ncbi:MAG: polysaccharide pyruvyl transferase family protein [Pricia sp.]